MQIAEARKVLKLFVIGGITALAVLVGMVLLPHDRYIRWQAMNSEAYARLGWLYEQVHFDKTPIDVAFLGTSHTMNGVDAAAVSKALAERGVRTEDGRCVTATNFAIPEFGRNLHAVLAREILENRDVDVLVLEVMENESRKPHRAFANVAEVRDVLRAPVLINLNYLQDILRLPYRQASLWFKSLFPESFGLKRSFDPANYDGSTVDNTRVINAGGKELSRSLDRTASPEALRAEVAQWNRDRNLSYLGPRFKELEFRFPRGEIDSILDLAEKKGVKVMFLYLPSFDRPGQPIDMSFYQGRGELITAPEVMAPMSNWRDAGHLNTKGAIELTQVVAQELERRANWARTEANAAECDFGHPPRAKLEPFREPRANP